MSEGEIHQIQKSRQMDTDESTYLKIIGDKTASLLSTCCEIGAASTSDDPEVHARLRKYGEYVGLAFQIKDDLLDYTGRKSVTGKPTGLDLGDGKLTLPIIHALGQVSRRDAKEILGIIKRGKKIRRPDVEAVLAFVENQGGLAYAARKAEEFSGYAKETLSGFPDSPSRDSLIRFADFVIARER
jgi:octaprenyl-diphosphate synthase